MMRSTPMKRTGFKSRSASVPQVLSREQRLDERAQRALQIGLAKPLARVAMVVCTSAVAAVFVKEKPLRSETYRRLVAAMPCAWCCIEGYSQHAHENEGKGFAMKVDDRRGMPLCCARPGNEGCHTAFDQYRLLPGGREAHRQIARRWVEETQIAIFTTGLWPANLPLTEAVKDIA